MKNVLHAQLKGAAQKLTAASILLAFSMIPGLAAVGIPVGMSLGSADSVRPGEPVTVIAMIEPGADFAYATFEVDQPEQWQILDGITRWAGALEKGKQVQFRFRAVPLTDQPAMMRASLSVDGYPTKRVGLDPARMGKQFPERSRVELDDAAKGEQRGAAESYQPQYDPSVALPEAARATTPRVPGEEATPEVQPQRSAKASSGRRASVVASGRWTYIDGNGTRRAVRNASVELWNEDPIALLNQFCGSAVTDDNGNFTVPGDCGDLAFGSDANPDLFVQLVLNNSVVEVKPDNLLAGTYTIRTGTKQNSPGGSVSFGTLTVPTNRAGAAAAHNLVMRAQQFMATVGESMSKVTVLWPSTSDSPVAFYTPVLATLNMKTNEPLHTQWAIFHEYGHHILITKAESPIPDYSNGNCDVPGHPGHCIDQPEKGEIAWTEGFPDFFGSVMHDKFNDADGYDPAPFNLENFTVNPDFNTQSEKQHTEGITAAILLDLVDSTNEAGDTLSMSFGNIWDVVKNYDPTGNILHNHPTSILEFYDGMRVQHLNLINRIAEVYAHNGLTRPRPDLQVSSLQNPPTAIPRGAVFSNDSTIVNAGNERANNAFAVRYQLALDSNVSTTRTLSTKTVGANMAAGASTDIAQTFTVPANLAPGLYRLMACADTGRAVPESDETDNCTTAATKVQVQ